LLNREAIRWMDHDFHAISLVAFKAIAIPMLWSYIAMVFLKLKIVPTLGRIVFQLVHKYPRDQGRPGTLTAQIKFNFKIYKHNINNWVLGLWPLAVRDLFFVGWFLFLFCGGSHKRMESLICKGVRSRSDKLDLWDVVQTIVKGCGYKYLTECFVNRHSSLVL
jgi:hypothetical protein